MRMSKEWNEMTVNFTGDNTDEIILKISSDNCTVRLSSLDESIESCRENLEPESKYKTRFTIKAFKVDENGEQGMEVGFIEGVYFEAESLFSEEIRFVMLCDAISSDAYRMAEAVTDKRGRIQPSICHREHNMVYVEKVYAEEQYRGSGVGRCLLDNMLPLLRHALCLRTHAVVLLPYPQEKTQSGSLLDAVNADADLPRLIRFYEKAGYTKLDGCDFMYMKCTDELDELLAQMDE